MSVNSSLFSNGSLLIVSINATVPYRFDCLIYKPSSFVFTSFTITNILLLLPLCTLVLYHGLQRWQQHRSSPVAATTHSDNFTYHLVIMEIINVFGTVFCCYGIYRDDITMLKVWYLFFSISWYGELIFHVLTCVEHYLAVVHPITYLSLREKRWIRIRNISIGCTWLLCFGLAYLVALNISTFIMDMFLLMSSVIIISFCNISVLCILVRPGPVEQGRDRGRIDQSKQRAFYTIEAIMAVMLLSCVWNVVWSLEAVLHGEISKCVWVLSYVWINLPSSLVLPLLFLQRTGTLTCCKYGLRFRN